MQNNIVIDCLTKIKTEDGNYRKLMSSDFRDFGEHIQIYPQAKIIKPEVITIGDYVMIDDFTFIYGGNGIVMKERVHIASFVSIIGGGLLFMGKFCALAAGVRVIVGTNTYKGGYHMTASAKIEEQNLVRGTTVMGDDVVIGTNSVIHPNVNIGDGAIIGSNSLVLKDVEPWTINVGSPCKVIGIRERIREFKQNGK